VCHFEVALGEIGKDVSYGADIVTDFFDGIDLFL
jgi:hypothetical protein